jgi:glycosyltransferase involved in cell wall biosynthesis
MSEAESTYVGSSAGAGPASLRVAMVCNAYRPHVGGVETHVGHLVDALGALGVRVEVLTQETDHSLPAREHDGPAVVRRFPSVVSNQRDAQAPGLWSWIRRHAADHDLVHFHSYHALVSASALLTGTPVVFTPHYHGTGHSPIRAAAHRIYRPVGRRVFSRAGAVICVSGAEAAVVERDFFARVNGKIQVIPNGVDVHEVRRADPMRMAAPYFLTLGRLERYKRVDRVINAMTLVPDPVRLVILGSGPALPDLIDLATRRGLTHRIDFMRDMPRAAVLRWLAGAHAVVSMSEHEAFGLTLAVGLAAGRRVVASDLPAHREVSRFGSPEALRLVPASAEAAELAAALIDCLGTARDLDRGASVLSWDDVAARTLAVYRSLTTVRELGLQSRLTTRSA